MQTTEVIVRHGTAELARESLPPGEYVIGRSRDANIHAETPLISRLHARLTLHEDYVLIEDLASSNGTFIDGQQIFETTRLEPGQALSLGDVQVELVRPPAPSSATSMAPLPSIEHLLPDELLSQQRYAIGQQVARGGMGAILQAEQAPMKRRVAMKVMLESCDTDDVLRFVEEAQITGQLEHPGIVPIYELGIDEQRQLFYTMKYVRGITLKKVLELIGKGVEATAKKFPLPALLTIFQKTCDAIAFAHSKGVIHRDLKPENIMLGDFGEVLVMDWGLAKVLGAVSQPNIARLQRTPVSSSRRGTGGTSYTMSGTVLGTPQYMAPEQARGEVDALDVRADIYALGGILFEILHLRAPFSGIDAWDIVEKVKRGEVEWSAPSCPSASPSSSSSDVPTTGAKQIRMKKQKQSPLPESLLAICRKALSFDREQRYARVDELQDDIYAYQHGFVTSAEKPSWPKRVVLAVKRNKTVSIAAALVTFAVLFFGTHAVIQGRTAKRALADLKRNAPALMQLATNEAGFRQFDSALEKIDGAISIDPTLRAAYWQRAWMLVGLERWADAAAALRLAKQKDPAKAALAAPATALDEIAKMPDEKARFASAQMPVVMDHLDRAGVPGIRLHFAQKLVVDAEKKQKAVQERLDQWRGTGPGKSRAELFGPMKWIAVRLGAGATVDTIEPMRGLPIEVLTFSSRSVTSLEPLRGMPLRELECGGTPIDDLGPLQGMPLRRLYIGGSKVEDLSPLKGLPIEQLDLTNTLVTDASPLAGLPLKYLNWTSGRVTDLSPLKGAPLETALLYNTQVADLSFLAGAPITRLEIHSNRIVSDLRPLAGLPIADLNLENCAAIKDLRPLFDLPALEKLKTSAKRSEIAVLRNHPTLKFIAIGNGPHRAIADYWAESDAVLPTTTGVERRLLRTLDLAESPEVTNIDFVRGLPFEMIDLRRTKVADISAIAGMKTLSVLRLATCPITDFSPIKGLPLTELRIGSSSFDDLSLLEGMPLGLLTIDNTPIADVAPLAKMTSLRMICLPRGAQNIEMLRQLPQLTHIGYNFNVDREAPDRTAADFWREFDAEKKAGGK